MIISAREEDYLKLIWKYGSDGRLVPLKLIIDGMGVVPGTVTAMLKNLDASGYIEYRSRKGCVLTSQGKKSALATLRRHRLLETFLVDIMKMEWHEVHAEAEVLEHVISDRFVEQMDNLLDSPLFDPHGDPIPQKNGDLPPTQGIRLDNADFDSLYKIVRVLVDDSKILEQLGFAGLIPGKTLKRFAKSGIGTVSLRTSDEREHSITTELASQILVTKI